MGGSFLHRGERKAMKCTILHEGRGRMRVHVCAVRMTLHRADVLEAYLNGQDIIQKATVYERTGDVVLTYRGSRKDAAALLQERFAQVEDYSQLYSMNQAQVGQARLFVSGDYVALLILGQTPEEELTADAGSQWFRGEGGKVDAAWKDIFGAADNQIVLK